MTSGLAICIHMYMDSLATHFATLHMKASVTMVSTVQSPYFGLVLLEVPILKSGDPMIPSNNRTIMNGHYLAKLYGLLVKSELIDGQRRMVAVQLSRQTFESGSGLWVIYSPSEPLLRREEPIREIVTL